MSEEIQRSESTDTPNPVLTGPEDPQVRRWREKLAAGAVVPPAPEGERAVSFALGPDDLRAFHRYAARRQNYLPLFAILATGFIVLSVLRAVSTTSSSTAHPVQQGSSSDPLTIVVSLVISLILPLAVFLGFVFILVRYVRKNQNETGTFDPRTVSISSEYLTSRDALGEGKIPWKVVKDIQQTEKHLFVLMPNNTGHTIPSWAFGSLEDAKAFFDEATTYWRSAH